MRIIGFLVLLLLVGVVGVVAYDAGLTAGINEATIAEGATVVYATGGGGVSVFGVILGLFFLVLLVGLVARLFFGRPAKGVGWGAGPGPWGYGRWGRHGTWSHEDVPEPFRPTTHSRSPGWMARPMPSNNGRPPKPSVMSVRVRIGGVAMGRVNAPSPPAGSSRLSKPGDCR